MSDLYMNRIEQVLEQLTVSTKQHGMNGMGVAGEKSKEYTKKEFLSLFPSKIMSVVLEELDRSESLGGFDMHEHAKKWVKALLELNVPGGKLNRGLTVVHATAQIKPDASAQLLEQAAILGWCVEILQAYFLVADDLMDSSLTRRGQPTWYLSDAPVQMTKNPNAPKEKVGLIAVNDSLILEGIIYRLLRFYFRSHPCYVSLLELFTETTYQTELGQLLDLTSQPQGEGNCDLDTLKIEAYSKIVIYKTAFYSFYMPVALAMLITGYDVVRNRDAFSEALSILLPMGEFFQIQDDYLDCYGDPKVIGKVGRDIEEKKCGWLVVQALKIATPAQRKIIEDNYGRDDPTCVARVKALYRDLNIERIYLDYEEKSYQHIRSLFTKTALVPKAVYESFISKIYKRTI